MVGGSIVGLAAGLPARSRIGLGRRGGSEKMRSNSRALKAILKLGMDSSLDPVLLEFIAFGRSSPALSAKVWDGCSPSWRRRRRSCNGSIHTLGPEGFKTEMIDAPNRPVSCDQ